LWALFRAPGPEPPASSASEAGVHASASPFAGAGGRGDRRDCTDLGHQQAARTDRPAVGQRHCEPAVLAIRADDLTGYHVTAITADLSPTTLQQLGRPDSVLAQQPMYCTPATGALLGCPA